ncbi:hypothetical protein Syun_028073 [Stephania yunnanensis]|uniref:CW-type domain-containing protein n=1 Tax=Stephania yunnanensis TaxID=152371 RepID=A0AAP0HQI2_9MAGN
MAPRPVQNGPSRQSSSKDHTASDSPADTSSTKESDYFFSQIRKKTIFTARSSGGQDQWAQCDNCSKWRRLPMDVLVPPKWSCIDNAWDPKRCVCSGLDALATTAVLGEEWGDSGATCVATTTKHPRHRPGCTCIACIQPPSEHGLISSRQRKIDEAELCSTQPTFNSKEDVSVDRLTNLKVKEDTQMEDYLIETSEECEVFQIEPEIVIALNEGEDDLKIDVNSYKPEMPQIESEEDQPLVLVQPPTLSCTFGTPYKGWK